MESISLGQHWEDGCDKCISAATGESRALDEYQLSMAIFLAVSALKDCWQKMPPVRDEQGGTVFLGGKAAQPVSPKWLTKEPGHQSKLTENAYGAMTNPHPGLPRAKVRNAWRK